MAPLQRWFLGPLPNLVEQTHRNAPVGHGAGRVFLGDFGKLLLSLFVSEGMEQSDATLESFLGSGRARDGKRNLAELLGSFVMMGMHFIIESEGRRSV